jgi:hypothetical protein
MKHVGFLQAPWFEYWILVCHKIHGLLGREEKRRKERREEKREEKRRE